MPPSLLQLPLPLQVISELSALVDFAKNAADMRTSFERLQARAGLLHYSQTYQLVVNAVIVLVKTSPVLFVAHSGARRWHTYTSAHHHSVSFLRRSGTLPHATVCCNSYIWSKANVYYCQAISSILLQHYCDFYLVAANDAD
jgi:hypothetical protein